MPTAKGVLPCALQSVEGQSALGIHGEATHGKHPSESEEANWSLVEVEDVAQIEHQQEEGTTTEQVKLLLSDLSQGRSLLFYFIYASLERCNLKQKNLGSVLDAQCTYTTTDNVGILLTTYSTRTHGSERALDVGALCENS